jgi:parallel beta-helix repeat protein
MSGCTIRQNKANRVWNALDLWDSNDNVIENNDFSHCSNVCLKLWRACGNKVLDNNLSYGLRISPGEVHARDSTSVLMETGSDHNRFERNDITHGGDGVFIRVLNGWCSRWNTFIENDCSYANNNGFEAWSPDNTYIRNKSNYCSYGFWLGGSDHTVLIGNEAAYNGQPDGFHNAPEPEFNHGGIVIVSGSGSHTVIEGHPFYTGKQTIVDTAGQVERFQKRLERSARL